MVICCLFIFRPRKFNLLLTIKGDRKYKQKVIIHDNNIDDRESVSFYTKNKITISATESYTMIVLSFGHKITILKICHLYVCAKAKLDGASLNCSTTNTIVSYLCTRCSVKTFYYMAKFCQWQKISLLSIFYHVSSFVFQASSNWVFVVLFYYIFLLFCFIFVIVVWQRCDLYFFYLENDDDAVETLAKIVRIVAPSVLVQTIKIMKWYYLYLMNQRIWKKQKVQWIYWMLDDVWFVCTLMRLLHIFNLLRHPFLSSEGSGRSTTTICFMNESKARLWKK